MTPKELREKLRLDQAGMAAKLGCSAGHISLIESNQRNPSYEILTGYAVAAKGKRVTFPHFTVTKH